MKWFQFLKDTIAPKHCLACKNKGSFFCQQCVEQVPYFSWNNYYNLPLHQTLIWTHYNSPNIKKVIHEGKFYGKKEVYADIAPEISNFAKQHISLSPREKVIIIGVPMHFLRRWKRGYNHSDILAQEIGKILEIPFKKHVLQKICYTPQQSHLSREERLKNLIHAIQVSPKYSSSLKNTTIIVVDDVVSTGATLQATATALKKVGVKKIIALAIASD